MHLHRLPSRVLSASVSRIRFCSSSAPPISLLSSSLRRTTPPATPSSLQSSFAPSLKCVLTSPTRGFATESPEQPRTFANQESLPRLPIPTLQETADRYVKSLRPILPDNEFKQAGKAVAQFVEPGGLGETLQQRLKEVDEKEKNSWLETMWLQKGYLEWRDPSYINVNWWAQFKDAPGELSDTSDRAPTGKASDLQLKRAAGLISNLLNFNDLVNSETLPPDHLGKKRQPLCMNQYRNQFGSSRVAESPADRIAAQFPCNARHVVVIYKDQIFKVDVISEKGERVPVKALFKQLQKVVDAVENHRLEVQPPVGVLTTEHRDVWAKARTSLLQKQGNSENLDVIDKAILGVCLETAPGGSGIDDFHPTLQHNGNGRNRWYDKALQLIVATDGKAGFNGEHTPADAVIPGVIADFVVKNEPARDPPGAITEDVLPAPRHLRWQVPPDVERAIQEAERSATKLASNIDTKLLHYTGYGSSLLKEAKVSPDAYVQMALQLAYYRLFMVPCPTYETASTRAFLHGRTETVRSCSVDSVKFTEAFDNPSVKKDEKLAIFQKAVSSHLEYMMSASQGKGVDRHLMGLRVMMANDTERSRATLFTDPSYAKSMYFKLSTSNMSPGTYLWGGFAPVVPEGFGVNYAIGKDMIKFSVATWKPTCEAPSTDFRESIAVALDDMAKMFGPK